MPLQIGQRVVYEAELGLGLGEVTNISGRNVEIFFAAVGQKRLYRLNTAPIRRVVLHIGQMAIAKSGAKFRVESVREEDDLMFYSGEGQEICETELEAKIPLGGAIDRLRAHNLSSRDALEMHIAAWKVRATMLGGKIRGLSGSRVGLLPHQLYVAYRVSRLGYPRVLLADQVGLGKTIEAGMIFNALRSLGRADRVLIVVPDSLVHQWLAEMARRFNEIFRLITKEAVDDEAPFTLNSRCLTTWGALKTGLYEQAIDCEWDLVIIDEAHHLREGQFAHNVASSLSLRTRGLLLLTGTPARNGAQSEFTLLKLVDPQRYANYEDYKAQRAELHAIADAARTINEGGSVYAPARHENALKQLLELLPHDEAFAAIVERFRNGEEEAQGELIDALIDRHGPGRVIFRNRRERLQKLFPGRHIELVPLRIDKSADEKVIDPRLLWIVDFLNKNPQEKVVVISSKAEVAVALHNQLLHNWNVDSAVFHEGLPLVERDRQTVWFAAEDGARLLICSEIGSEGRNFQFAHNMVFWDVPVQPDIIEQRIGRLDRIGQNHIVSVFVLYLAGTPVEYLLRWHMGMGSFAGPVENSSEIITQVDMRNNLTPDKFPAMLEQSQALLKKYQAIAKENADYLVDLNSFNEVKGEALCNEVKCAEKSCNLPYVVARLLEMFGLVLSETRRPGVFVLQAAFTQQLDMLLGYRQDMVVTFNRNVAVMYEDVEYLTFDHPLVKSALSTLLDSGSGCAVALRWQGANRSGLLIQCLYVLEAIGPVPLELYRYMPPYTVTVTVDVTGKLFEEQIGPLKNMKEMGSDLLNMLLSKLGSRLDHLVEAAAKVAHEKASEYRQQTLLEADRRLQSEYSRLQELRKVNDMVSDVEVEDLAHKKEDVLKALSEAKPRLDGLRLILMEA